MIVRTSRVAAGPRRRAALSRLLGHSRPCHHASLVPLRRRGTGPYVPVRAGTWTHPQCRGPCPLRRDTRCTQDPAPRDEPPGRATPTRRTFTATALERTRDQNIPRNSTHHVLSAQNGHRNGRPADMRHHTLSARDGHPIRAAVERGFKIPGRTGTYELIPRRRSRTRPPWRQGRLCPSKRDSAACRRGPAASRFFHPEFFRGRQPSELRPPWVALPIKPMRGKTIRGLRTTAGVVPSGTPLQTPLRPRGSRPTSPALDEAVCSRACRALDLSTASRTLFKNSVVVADWTGDATFVCQGSTQNSFTVSATKGRSRPLAADSRGWRRLANALLDDHGPHGSPSVDRVGLRAFLREREGGMS
jgi:hypothetical protein